MSGMFGGSSSPKIVAQRKPVQVEQGDIAAQNLNREMAKRRRATLLMDQSAKPAQVYRQKLGPG